MVRRWLAIAALASATALAAHACVRAPLLEAPRTIAPPAAQGVSAIERVRARFSPVELPTPFGPVARPLLAPYDDIGFIRRGERLHAMPRAGRHRWLGGAQVELPARSPGAFALVDGGGARIEIALAGARTSEAEIAGGLVVYRGAAPGGGDVVQRTTYRGTEDWIELTRPLAALRYRLRLSPALAAVRHDGNGLAVSDHAGRTRFVMAAPELVDAQRRVRPLRIQIEPCIRGRDELACELTLALPRDLQLPALVDPSWMAAGSIAERGGGHSATSVPGLGVLVAGGATAALDPVATSECFQFEPLGKEEQSPTPPGTWNNDLDEDRMADRMLVSRYGHTATLLFDGRVLVVAGQGANKTVELFDPEQKIWVESEYELHPPRVLHTATLLRDGRVLVTGGGPTLGEARDDVQLFDPVTGTWSNLPSLKEPRTLHTATLLPDGRVLVAGGQKAGERPGEIVVHATAELFDPEDPDSGWQTLAMEAAHEGHIAALVHGEDGRAARVLVAGGTNGTGDSGVTSAELYDPTTGAWTSAAPMNRGRWLATAAVVAGNKVLVVGGSTPYAYEVPVSCACDLANDVANGTTTCTPSGTGGKGGEGGAGKGGDGDVVKGGGGSGGAPAEPTQPCVMNVPTDTVERYDPDTDSWSEVGIPPMAHARIAPAVVVLANDGRVLVAGGVGSGATHSELLDNFGDSTTTCFGDNDCAGGKFCSHGFCCNEPCKEACRSCRGEHIGTKTNGTCGDVLASTDPNGDCNNTGASCGTTGDCDGDGACDTWSDDDCTPLECQNDADCASGLPCVHDPGGSYCCDTPCGGVCDRCDLEGTEGLCNTSPAGDPCPDGYCDGDDATTCQPAHAPGAACDESYQCQAEHTCVFGVCCAEVSCGAYRCGGDGDCLAACGSTADCAPGHRCDGGGRCVPASPASEPDPGCGCAVVGRTPRSLAWATLLLLVIGRRRRA